MVTVSNPIACSIKEREQKIYYYTPLSSRPILSKENFGEILTLIIAESRLSFAETWRPKSSYKSIRTLLDEIQCTVLIHTTCSSRLFLLGLSINKGIHTETLQIFSLPIEWSKRKRIGSENGYRKSNITASCPVAVLEMLDKNRSQYLPLCTGLPSDFGGKFKPWNM